MKLSQITYVPTLEELTAPEIPHEALADLRARLSAAIDAVMLRSLGSGVEPYVAPFGGGGGSQV